VREIIDLTWEMVDGMPRFGAPWHPDVNIRQIGHIETEGRETRSLYFGSHSGTHMDAPLHFIRGGRSIDQIPLEQLIGPVTILNLSDVPEKTEITRDMLRDRRISPRVIFNFGWGRHWGTEKFYRDYPSFSREAAEYLISRQVRVVAMDTPSPDRGGALDPGILGSEADSPVHKLFLKKGVIIIEYVANLDSVRDLSGWTMVGLPLRIKGADGSPIRLCIFR
jgi:arylformamidase